MGINNSNPQAPMNGLPQINGLNVNPNTQATGFGNVIKQQMINAQNGVNSYGLDPNMVKQIGQPYTYQDPNYRDAGASFAISPQYQQRIQQYQQRMPVNNQPMQQQQIAQALARRPIQRQRTGSTQIPQAVINRRMLGG